MRTGSGGRYVHGTHPEEQARLSALNDLINQRCLAGLRLQPGASVLDLGCGLGQMTRLMARSVAPGRVVGIERSAEQLAGARGLAIDSGEENLVEFREGDAAALPLANAEWGSFDVAHTRFLLEHLPDPGVVVRLMARAVRPGGRVILLDDDHDTLRLWPEPPGLMAVWHVYTRTYDRFGNDPYVGRRLVELLHGAGLRPSRSDLIFFGACAGDGALEGYVENLARILEGARQPILTTGPLSSDQFEAALSALRAWANRPDAAFWYGIPLAEGVRAD